MSFITPIGNLNFSQLPSITTKSKQLVKLGLLALSVITLAGITYKACKNMPVKNRGTSPESRPEIKAAVQRAKESFECDVRRNLGEAIEAYSKVSTPQEIDDLWKQVNSLLGVAQKSYGPDTEKLTIEIITALADRPSGSRQMVVENAWSCSYNFYRNNLEKLPKIIKIVPDAESLGTRQIEQFTKQVPTTDDGCIDIVKAFHKFPPEMQRNLYKHLEPLLTEIVGNADAIVGVLKGALPFSIEARAGLGALMRPLLENLENHGKLGSFILTLHRCNDLELRSLCQTASLLIPGSKIPFQIFLAISRLPREEHEFFTDPKVLEIFKKIPGLYHAEVIATLSLMPAAYRKPFLTNKRDELASNLPPATEKTERKDKLTAIYRIANQWSKENCREEQEIEIWTQHFDNRLSDSQTRVNQSFADLFQSKHCLALFDDFLVKETGASSSRLEQAYKIAKFTIYSNNERAALSY